MATDGTIQYIGELSGEGGVMVYDEVSCVILFSDSSSSFGTLPVRCLKEVV